MYWAIPEGVQIDAATMLYSVFSGIHTRVIRRGLSADCAFQHKNSPDKGGGARHSLSVMARRACVRAWVRACVRACVRVCQHACLRMHGQHPNDKSS